MNLNPFRRSPPTIQEQLAAKLANLEEGLAHRYMESIDLTRQFAYPDPVRDDSGTIWQDLGGGVKGQSPQDASNFRDEQQLTAARDYCRWLARKNPYAINLLENIVSYVVGEGHKVTIAGETDEEIEPTLLAQAQDAFDEWEEANDWCKRQQEIALRMDRDGEVFLRKFEVDGVLHVRFVEPYRIQQPKDNDRATFGIECEPDDVETPKYYYISSLSDIGQSERVPAEEIQHRKANVDCNVKRGVPTLYAIGKELDLVAKLQENMGAIATIQTSIAAIRYHAGATKAGLENMRAANADYTRQNVVGRTEYSQEKRKARYIDVADTTKYEFPPSPDVTGWIEGASFNLRSIAARVQMPEFMLTSDASNSNYASTMVAEGPAVRMFQRRQAAMKECDEELIWEAMEKLAEAGRFPLELLGRIDIQIEAPTVVVRDEKAEADTNKVYKDMGILSPQTITASIGYDYEQEQANIEEHDKQHPDAMKQAELQVMATQANPQPNPVMPKLEHLDYGNIAARTQAWTGYPLG